MRLLMSALLCVLLGLWAGPGFGGQVASPSGDAPRRIAELRSRVAADNRAHPAAAIAWAEEALGLLAGAPDPEAEAWFLHGLSRDLNTLGEFPKAGVYLERGRKLVARTGDERIRLLLELEAAALFNNTEKYVEARGILGSVLPAMESFRRSHPGDFELARVLGRGYRLLAYGLQTNGKFQEAVQANQKAQAVARDIGDLHGQAQVLDNMGNLYTFLARFGEALDSHRQAIALSQRLSDAGLEATCRLSLANTWGHQGRTGEQLAELTRAASLAAQAEDVYIQLLASMNLADAHLRERNYTAALRDAEATLRHPDIARYPSFVAVSQVNKGIALNRLGRNSEGLRLLEEGFQHLKEAHATNESAEVAGNLAEELAFAGDFHRAYLAHGEFKALSDALVQAEDRRRVAEASAAFEADKKQMQIEGLQRERRFQARLLGLWAALGVLGFSIAGVLVLSRRRLQKAHHELKDLHGRNLTLIADLQTALTEVKTLQGLIPICAHCKKIRDDQGFWNQMECYIQNRSEATFSHGICPDCAREVLAELTRPGS